LQRKNVVIWMLGLGLTMSAGNWARAEEKAAAGAPAGVDPAMMAKAQEYMTPGAEHRWLDGFTGKWTAKVRMWMKPGDQPTTSDGTAENTWALNGHFLKQDFKGTWAGQNFEGTGFTGYDKVRAEYQSLWLDSMGTGMMYTTGTYDAAKKVLNQSGTFGCPMTGEKSMWYRSELKLVNKDKFTYTSYGKDPAGKEFKGMEIVYTRAK
jgi:hypothetical protein